MILTKIHQNNNGQIIVAMCDDSIKGKVIEEGEMVLDLTSSFYDGSEIDEKVFDIKISKASSVNAVGKESTDYLVSKGLIEKDSVMTLNDIPYALIVLE